MCLDLLKKYKEGDLTHKQKIDLIFCRFPKTKLWLDWWTMADVEAMLFPSRRQILEDLPEGKKDGLPDTTNTQESMHQLYYVLR
jgi:hypothetical protein